MPQVGQRAVAGAVVVDRHPDAATPELRRAHCRPRSGSAMRVSSTSSSVSASGGSPCAFQRGGHLARTGRVVDVRRRQVDRDRHPGGSATSGPPRSSASSSTVSVSGRSRPACSAAGRSWAGRGGRGVGWFPPDERLHPHDPAVGQSRPAAGGTPRAPRRLSAVRSSSMVRRRSPVPPLRVGHVDVHTLASGLGGVHGDVGAAQDSRWDESGPPRGAVATPMLTPTCSRMSSTLNG